jgi:MFS family permease
VAELEAALGVPWRERKAVGLICAGHFFSHFYLLLIPPLFPLLRDAYGVGFTELGVAVAAMSMTSTLAQVPMGFLVDRYGARAILIAGIYLESLAIALVGVFPLYAALVALMVAAGFANAIYHPADYALLNATVDRRRIGRSFSYHTFSGHMGDALGPVAVLFLASFLDWRAAIFICGAGGAVVATLLWVHAGALDDPAAGREAESAGPTGQRTGIALLLSVPVLMGLLFFTGISITARGYTNFGIASLHELYGTPLAMAGVVLSCYLFASPAGVLLGGLFADRIVHHDRVAAGCFLVMCACAATLAAFDLPLAVIGALFAVAGFCNGFLAPPRDMMIRALTSPKDVGKVFAFVSTGYSIGGTVAPILYGWLLDQGGARDIFWLMAGVALLSIASVFVTGATARHAGRR